MSKRIFIDHNGESVEEIMEAYDDATIITFSTGANNYIEWTDYRYYPQHKENVFKKWVWKEGEYHFKGKCNEIPSLSLIKHIKIFKAEGRSMSDWETIVIRNPQLNS